METFQEMKQEMDDCQDVAQEENKNVDKDDCPKEVEDTTKKMKLL